MKVLKKVGKLPKRAREREGERERKSVCVCVSDLCSSSKSMTKVDPNSSPALKVHHEV